MPVPMYSSNERSLPKLLLIILLILVGITGLTFLISRFVVRPYLTLKHPVTVLLAGEDPGGATDQFPRMDTFVLAFIHPETGKVSLISIPGSIQANPPGPGTPGEVSRKRDILSAEKLISELTKTKIDRYLEINFSGFQQLVDLLDGVEVNVSRLIKYTDKSGQPIVEITPGNQILTGEQALLYVRFLDANGEADRFAREEAVLTAIFKKATHTGNIFNTLKMCNALKKYTQTDLSPQEVLQLAVFAKTIDLHHDISVNMLPGSVEANYWKPDYIEIGKMVTRLNR